MPSATFSAENGKRKPPNWSELRKKYPEDPQVLRLMGVLYRMGYNLGMPGAWERAEAYLLRTEELLPDAPEALHLSRRTLRRQPA